MPDSREALTAYVPVIHRGYIDLFHEHSGADMQVLDSDVLEKFPHLRKDIRALAPQEAADIIESLNVFRNVQLLGASALGTLTDRYERIVMPYDEVSRQLTEDYFGTESVTMKPVFLRWDRENSFVNVEVTPDRAVQVSEENEELIRLLYEEAGKSSDWWRRVGAAIVKEGEIIGVSHNRHLPTEFSNQINSDPRNNAYRGVSIEASTVSHAEASLVANAARRGESLEGADIYVTTFPCPACAKFIAEAGVKTCYFIEGYAMTDGFNVLKDADVEIVKIDGVEEEGRTVGWVRYPEK